MKKTSIIGVVFALLGIGTVTTSCEDMLTPEMNNHVDGDAAITDTVYYFHGILKNVQDIAERTVILGEARGDLTSPGLYVSDSVYDVANFENAANGTSGLLDRSAYYKVINQCNFYIAHVDSNATMNSVKYMRSELAQVEMIRAWTYMQLVQNYGSVPFITEPVKSANTGWENTAPKATRENLLDRLGNELQLAYSWSKEYGLPNYLSYNTYSSGGYTVNSRLCMFPADLVMGDLYLMRGSSTSDFEKAAQYYYNYITENNLTMDESRKSTFGVMNYGTPNQSYSSSTTNWRNVFSSYSSGELITVVPSCAVKTMGTVLTDVQKIYGFELTSSQSASTSESDDGTEDVSITGSISPSPSEKYRQLEPSPAYLQLNAAQNYAGTVLQGTSEKELEYYEGAGDARLQGSAPTTTTTDAGSLTRSRFIHKFCPASNIFTNGASNFMFHYCIPMYRTALVYLRYAEALNRAGFPQHAFALLSHGINNETVPTLLDSMKVDSSEHTKTMVYYVDDRSSEDRAYIDADELRRAQSVSFIQKVNLNALSTVGIHSLGCGNTDLDTLYTFKKVVAQKIADESLRLGSSESEAQAKAARYLRQTAETTPDGSEEGGDGGDDNDGWTIIDNPPAKANLEEMNAIEDMIVDELALETAFEGNRYGDLMRIAIHKNLQGDPYSSDYGTKWMAWKIARRGENLKPYENPQQKDETLYQKLLNTSNWYLRNP